MEQGHGEAVKAHVTVEARGKVGLQVKERASVRAGAKVNARAPGSYYSTIGSYMVSRAPVYNDMDCID
jgi:hypothetical protein